MVFSDGMFSDGTCSKGCFVYESVTQTKMACTIKQNIVKHSETVNRFLKSVGGVQRSSGGLQWSSG